MSVAIKRVYEPASTRDGFRVLVDRIWPRGISKAKAKIDLWLREIGPSTALRKWFQHDPARWKTFASRYRAELRGKGELLASLRERAKRGRITLVYSARDERFNQAVVLRDVLGRRRRARRTRPS
jgi:uncharacterized protein YeaO (DUF488 family)